MNRWFRVYDNLVEDPKVQRLPDSVFRGLVNLWCLASQGDGLLPSVGDISFKLRIKPAQAQKLLADLRNAGLIVDDETGTHPHNWNGRQFKSDVSNERVKQHRKRKRNVTETVTETPPETEYREQKDSEANASGADAPIDHRKRLFNEGLEKLRAMTGKGPDACRSFVGKCLKASGDDAITVLGLIEDAERNQAVDPSAWIASRLKPTENTNGKPRSGIIQAADDLCRKIASFDGPPREAEQLRRDEGQNPTRLLSYR
jgi:hypothetical protein